MTPAARSQARRAVAKRVPWQRERASAPPRARPAQEAGGRAATRTGAAPRCAWPLLRRARRGAPGRGVAPAAHMSLARRPSGRSSAASQSPSLNSGAPCGGDGAAAAPLAWRVMPSCGAALTAWLLCERVRAACVQAGGRNRGCPSGSSAAGQARPVAAHLQKPGYRILAPPVERARRQHIEALRRHGSASGRGARVKSASSVRTAVRRRPHPASATSQVHFMFYAPWLHREPRSLLNELRDRDLEIMTPDPYIQSELMRIRSVFHRPIRYMPPYEAEHAEMPWG